MSDQLMSKTQQYSVSISPVLLNKLNHHLHLLQTLLGLQHQKRDWYIAAIEEKLARDVTESKVEKEKRIGFRLDQLTKKKLEDHIQNIRKSRNSFSKKQWILDAIEERLDEEEEIIKNRLLEYINELNSES